MRNAILAAFSMAWLLGTATDLSANGGGFFRGGVESAGDVAGFEPKATENVRILDEELTVHLGSSDAEVEVRYLMKNVTDRKVKVRFGFPVEESTDADAIMPKKSTPDPKRLNYCRDYRITASGAPLKATWQGEVNDGSDRRFRGIAGWMISEATFAPNEEKPLLIRFRSIYPNEEWSVSEHGTRSAGLFRYRLSTAACWHGSIARGRITLKPRGIDPGWIQVIKPVNRFKKEGNDWIWNFEDLEPTLADDFEIEARPAQASYPESSDITDGTFSEYIERRKRWTMAHSNYQVKASSTLPPDGDIQYLPENVRNPWSEMWSEGAKGPGTGEWLELTPKTPKPLTAIAIKPGCFKSAALFQANARPKKLRIQLNGEKTLSADIPDLMEEIEIPVTDYNKPVKHLRITFDEVWPGSRFEDLCITSIRLHVRLDKKPNLQPAR